MSTNKLVYVSTADKKLLSDLAEVSNTSAPKLARALLEDITGIKLIIPDRVRGRMPTQIDKDKLPSKHELKPLDFMKYNRYPVLTRMSTHAKTMLDILTHVTGLNRTILFHQFVINEYMKLDPDKIQKRGLLTYTPRDPHSRQEAYYKEGEEMIRPKFQDEIEDFPFGVDELQKAQEETDIAEEL